MSVSEATEYLLQPGQAFEIGEELVDEISTRVWKSCPPSLRSILELSASYGEAVFLVYEDERLTFSEHFAEASAFAHVLAEHYGVTVGDRVAIAMANLPEWSTAFWGAAALGAVIVPLNAWWTGPELQYGLEDSGAKVAVFDRERLERIEPYIDSLRASGLDHLVVARARDDGEVGAGGQGPSRGAGVGQLGQLPAGVERYEELTAAFRRSDDDGDPPQLPPAQVSPDDNATIFYTSGTTGKPKGALGTQRNICTNLMSLGFVNARSQLSASDEDRAAQSSGGLQNSYLLSVPLFHATGCHAILVGNTAAGGKLVMMRRWNPERALELIEREKITTFGGVPTMAWQVLESPDFDKRDTSSVRSVAYGGAPAPPELLRKIREHFPAGNASNGYGLTETSSVTSMNSGEDYRRKPDSVGPAVPVCEIRIVGPEGEEMPVGETGELWIKGPNVVRGYWNKPEATALSFTEGWLHSGDIAKLDDEGFIYIVDRAKDMVIRGGENVYSAEVEAAIFEHPAVFDAAVIGVPHQVLGEEVGAVVVLREGSSVTADELRDHLAERIAAFKVPRHVWFYEGELPRNPAGKVLKRELREEVCAR
ncbi:MAG: class I adenylate-forming enzyme family protein [Acidimicrobiales bacterium]